MSDENPPLAEPGRRRVPVAGELLSLAGLAINSLAVTLIIRSDFGMSVTSALPQVLALSFTGISSGLWNTLIQCLWLLATMLSLRRFRWGYLLSFGLALLFGVFMDGWRLALSGLPDTPPARAAYYVVGFWLMSVGIACMLRCRTPVLPFDAVPRAFIDAKGWSVRATRTGFDLINLSLSVGMSLLLFGRIRVVGIGTVVSAFCMGSAVSLVTRWMDARLDIRARWAWLERIS